MRCPFCSEDNDKVIDSRPSDEGMSIRRRRECLACGARFTTYEKVETQPILVIKKDGSREPFDRDKLRNNILKACHKRPVTSDQLDGLVDYVEQTIRNSLRYEVSSQEIGELVMDQLRQIDEVAYVRFASVYRQFKDVESFMVELRQLLEQDNLMDPTKNTEDPQRKETSDGSEG